MMLRIGVNNIRRSSVGPGTGNLTLTLLPTYGITHSMSRAGTPADNAAMEAINGWIKAELFMDFHVTGEKPIAEEVAEYVQFFNTMRPAYSLGYLTPEQFRESNNMF